MLDAKGETVGFDLFVEVQPDVWLPADKVPPGVLAEERRRGQLQHGIYYAGRLIDRLNVHNVNDQLIAAKHRLELKVAEYKGGATAFKAQIGNPLEQLTLKIKGLIQQLEELRGLDAEAKVAELEALKSRLKKAKRTTRILEKEKEEEKIRPEQVEPHPLDFLTDITRAYGGKARALSTASLEQLAKAEQISDFVEESGSSLLLDANKMRALRSLLLQ
jgi:hypothetical protein